VFACVHQVQKYAYQIETNHFQLVSCLHISNNIKWVTCYPVQLVMQLHAISLSQCFSTFLLQQNLPHMFVLLMEPHAMIQVSILLQPHRTVVTDFLPCKFGLFWRNIWQPLTKPWDSMEPRLKNTDQSCAVAHRTNN